MPEHDEIQRLVIAECRKLGLHAHHCDMRRSQPGFPDLVIVGLGGVLWRELKVPPDAPSREQRALGYTLAASRQDYRIWTPEDWDSGKIAEELEGVLTRYVPEVG